MDTPKESFAAKRFLFATESSKGFVEQYRFFRVSCETIKGFVQNQIFTGFAVKPLMVLYEALKICIFL